MIGTGYTLGMVRSWRVASDLPAIDVRPLFPAERSRLLGLLGRIRHSDWACDTVCSGWTVHDIALHLLGNDLSRISRPGPGWEQARKGEVDFLALSELIERSNDEWVRATRRIPPQLLVEFLALAGAKVDAAFARVDLWTEGLAVAWSGTGPSPFWLDMAREYTERWVHHQQIRLALGRPVLSGRRWLHPVLAAFMLALPRAYDEARAPVGTRVAIMIDGPAGGRWLLRRSRIRWRLMADDGHPVASEVRMDQDLAWRFLTRLTSAHDALPAMTISGSQELRLPIARAVAIMTTEL